MEKLELCVYIAYKHSSEIRKWLKCDKLINFYPNVLSEYSTTTEEEMCKSPDYNVTKRAELLEATLEALYAVVLSIFNPVLKEKVVKSEVCVDIDIK